MGHNEPISLDSCTEIDANSPLHRRRVSVLDGGFPAWSAEGFPVSRSTPADGNEISAPGEAAHHPPASPSYNAHLLVTSSPPASPSHNAHLHVTSFPTCIGGLCELSCLSIVSVAMVVSCS